MNRAFICIILIALTFNNGDRISDYRLCGDPECSKPISLGKTMLRYRSDDRRLLSFEYGVQVEIYSKSAGSRHGLWGAKIKGKRGYIPSDFVREYKIFTTDLNFTVPTEYNIASKLTDDITTKSNEDDEISTKSIEDTEIAANSVEKQEIVAKSVATGEIAAEDFGAKEMIVGSTYDTKNEIGRFRASSMSQSIVSSSTPSLTSHSPSANANPGSFSFKGVSAESSENKSPSPNAVVKPFDVIHGTTVYYSTDGETENISGPVVKVKATAVLHDTIPSTAVHTSSLKSEDSRDSGHEHAKLITAQIVELSEEVEKSSKLYSSKSETENFTNGKNVVDNNKQITNEAVNKNYLIEDNEEVHVSDDDDDDDDDDEDDDDDNEDDDDEDGYDEESGVERGNSKDEIVVEHDASKVVDSKRQATVLSAADADASVLDDSSSVESTDSRTESEDVKADATRHSALPSLDRSDLQSPKTPSFGTTVKNDSGDAVELGRDGKSPSALDSHETKLETIKADISEGKGNILSGAVVTNSSPTSESGDKLLSVEIITSDDRVSDYVKDLNFSMYSLDINETQLSGDRDSLAEPSVIGETVSNAVTEIPMDAAEAIPPVDFGSPTENPLSLEQKESTEKSVNNIEGLSAGGESSHKVKGSSQDVEGSSNDVEGSSNDVEGSSNDVEGSSNDVEGSSNDVEGSFRDVEGSSQDIVDGSSHGVAKSSDIVHKSSSVHVEEISLQKVESSTPESTPETISSNSGGEQELTEHRDDITDSEIGNETDQQSVLGDRSLQENVDDSDRKPSNSIVERETAEVQSGKETEPDSSGSLVSGVADTLRHGYENVVGLFWSVTPKEPVTTEGAEPTTSRPDEGISIDVKNVEKDADPVGANLSAESADDSGEMSGSKLSSLSPMWGTPDTKVSPPQITPETVPESSDVCRTDTGVDNSCVDVGRSLPAMDKYSHVRKLQQDMDHMHKAEEEENDNLSGSNVTIWFVMSTGILVTIFTLGFIYLEKNKFNRSLVAEVNALKKALQIKLIENISKSDEGVLEHHRAEESEATVASLQQQLENSQERCAELEEKVVGLEKELETATETGLELNKMLGDILSSQQDSDQLVHNMEDLRRQLNTQEAAMKADLATKTSENEKLQALLDKVLERNNQLDEEIEILKETLEKSVTKQEQLQENSKEFEIQLSEEQQRAEKLSQELSMARQTLEEVNQALAIKDSEVTVLQDCLKQTRAGEGEEEGIDKFQALLDVGHVRAELKMVSLERDALSDRVRGEEGARKLLEDHVEVITKEVGKLRLRYEEAEKEKMEAQTRLEVLSNYFKEKETQLQKELGLQEAMNLQKDGDVISTFERIHMLQDEVENYKSQVETMKKEILDQERGLKSQISALEKKAHENWVAARQAERRLEDSKQEAGQLRNRLTIVEKNITNTSTPNGDTNLKMAERLPSESNGELPISPPLIDSPLHYRDGLPVSPPLIPPFMLPPPGVPFMPPPAFMPPPPPTMFPGDRRPPPLGRMSSPPPRFSPPPPPSDYSPSYDGRSEDHSPPPYHSPVHFDDRYRRRTPPRWDQPVGPRSVFRPPPPNLRTTPREPRGSAVSSGHSSESLEKSSRHSDNVV